MNWFRDLFRGEWGVLYARDWSLYHDLLRLAPILGISNLRSKQFGICWTLKENWVNVSCEYSRRLHKVIWRPSFLNLYLRRVKFRTRFKTALISSQTKATYPFESGGKLTYPCKTWRQHRLVFPSLTTDNPSREVQGWSWLYWNLHSINSQFIALRQDFLMTRQFNGCFSDEWMSVSRVFETFSGCLLFVGEKVWCASRQHKQKGGNWFYIYCRKRGGLAQRCKKQKS